MNVDEALALEAKTTWPPGCEQDEMVHVLAAEVRRLRKAITEMSEDLNEVIARGDL